MKDNYGTLCAEFERYWRDWRLENPIKPKPTTESLHPYVRQGIFTTLGLEDYQLIVKDKPLCKPVNIPTGANLSL